MRLSAKLSSVWLTRCTADAYKAAADLDQSFLDKMKGVIAVNEVDPKPFQVKAESRLSGLYQGIWRRVGRSHP